jgi:hypothetical protein
LRPHLGLEALPQPAQSFRDLLSANGSISQYNPGSRGLAYGECGQQLNANTGIEGAASHGSNPFD